MQREQNRFFVLSAFFPVKIMEKIRSLVSKGVKLLKDLSIMTSMPLIR